MHNIKYHPPPVLRLERDAWSIVKLLRQATNEYAPPPPVLLVRPRGNPVASLDKFGAVLPSREEGGLGGHGDDLQQ